MNINTAGWSRCLLLAAVLAVQCGCMSRPPDFEDYAATLPEEMPDTRVANGSIFQTNRDVALFENPVAGRAGDILTIRLVENTAASKSANTATSKETNLDIGANTAVLGRPMTINGAALAANMDNSSDFTGSGSSAQSNSLVGDITVTVVKRYANGNLLVRGQKWITINQGREFVRIQGMVRAIDVAPDNTVLSTKVADASIAYGGQGVLASANAKGWLSRFFDSPLTPF